MPRTEAEAYLSLLHTGCVNNIDFDARVVLLSVRTLAAVVQQMCTHAQTCEAASLEELSRVSFNDVKGILRMRS